MNDRRPSSRARCPIRLAIAITCLIGLALASGCPGHDPNPQVRASDCQFCHLLEYEEASDPVHIGVYAERCVGCHNNLAWRPEDNSGHDDALFPITSGAHAGLPCEECHPAPDNTFSFKCTDCHAHERPAMDAEHRGVGGYVYESSRCLDCHPNG